jgi:capsular exopolysaccharide synthesis family protein
MVEMFRKQINVRRITYSQLIEISTTSNDPVLAAKLTNTLGEIYAGEYKERILSMTKELARMIQSEKQSGEANEQAYEALENILGVNKASKIGRLKASRDDTQKLLDELSVNYKEGHPQINALNNKIHELDAEMNQEINNALQNWENSLALHGKHLLSTVTIAEYAEVPKKPIGPKRFRGILFFSFLGLASGCGFVFILYQLDPRIRSEEDLIKETGLTSLGVVPRVASDIPLDDFSRLPQELKDIFAYIRTTVLFSMPEGKSKVILLTSVLRSEGRTTIATNLACSFANDGLKTVLIDADTREARAHSVFNLRKTPGLTNFLKGEINTDAILLNSGIQNLTVVPAGDPVSNPSELLSQVKMAELMKSLKEKFDKVIIDTPPVLNIADEFVLASLADGVVLVIDSEKSDERVLRRVVNEFRQMNETLLGGIINQYDISKHRNYLDVYFKFEKDFSQISGRVVREQLLKLFPKK